MADVLTPTIAVPQARFTGQPTGRVRAVARARRRRDDVWIAAAALVAAALALPQAQSTWHGPEVAAVLAVAATALFAGQRWAIAVIVLAELLLVPTLWPRAFVGDASLLARLPAFGSLLAMVPGVLAMRRAAAALVLVFGIRRTRTTCRALQFAIAGVGLVAAALPLF